VEVGALVHSSSGTSEPRASRHGDLWTSTAVAGVAEEARCAQVRRCSDVGPGGEQRGEEPRALVGYGPGEQVDARFERDEAGALDAGLDVVDIASRGAHVVKGDE
jgi:hypothetical protein